ncbi:short-chain dehydrogenase [Stagonosporopsis vannaccii]|nr:short-chain dehydrogenase [Stagonosporopsis vannaccii]
MVETYSFYTSLIKSLLSLAFARLYKTQEVPTRDLTGQKAIVTGANSGIGLSIAVALAKQGADVYLACRNEDRGATAVEHVVAQCDKKSQAKVTCRILDLGDLSSVRAFCEQWPKRETIDIIVHNAGIAAPPTGSATKTREGLDIIYATNFLGSFLMTSLLEPHLSPTARIVMTSSTGSYSAVSHFLAGEPSGKAKPSAPGIIAQVITKGKAILGIDAESSAPAYGLSKAQQVLFAALLQRRFNAKSQAIDSQKTSRSAHAFTPGFTSTPIFGKFDVTWQTWFSNPLFAILKTTQNWVAVPTDEGAKTGIWLATWGDKIGAQGRGGAFWERMQRRTSVVDLMDEKRRINQWGAWESDAEIVWSV